MALRYPTIILLKVFFLAGLWLAGVADSAIAADIRDTKHNLSGRTKPGKARATVGSEDERRLLDREVCVFCHTPTLLEGSIESAMDEPTVGSGEGTRALWQRSLAPGFSYSLFDDIGRLGAEGVGSVGSVSMACLSCHDWNQAFGVSAGSLDHPFGVPYRGVVGNQEVVEETRRRLRSSPTAAFSLASGQNLDVDTFRPVQSAVIGGRRVWWASTVNSAQRSKSDLPLYPRHNPNAPAPSPDTPVAMQDQIPFVECTSCHDPHTTRDVFLRRTNTGSGSLCMTCHAK